MSQRKKILLLCPSLSNGGAEKVVSIMSQELITYYDIYLVLLDGTDITYNYKGEIIDLKYKDILKKSCKISFFNRHLATFLSIFLLIIKLRKVKKKLGPTCSISFLETSNVVNILSSVGERILVSVRSTRSIQNRSFYERMENKGISLYKWSDMVISVSNGVKEDLIRNFGLSPQKIHTIYNPYQIEFIRSLMNETIEEEYDSFFRSHKVVTIVGRLVPDKKQERLLNCFNTIKEKAPGVGCLIIGSGNRLTELKNLAHTLNIEDDVLFIPYTKNPFKYIYKSEVFLSTSEREGFPNNIIEAMICGVPVVSVDCYSGPREIICGDNNYDEEYIESKITTKGILVPLQKNDKDNIALSNALISTLTNSDVREYVTKDVEDFIFTLKTDMIMKEWQEVIEG